MRILTAQDIVALARRLGIRPLLRQVTDTLAEDFGRCTHLPGPVPCLLPTPSGEIALRPWSDGHYFGFKYEAHQPAGVGAGRPNRRSLGVLGLVETGEPLLLADMTLLTALRTAATAALGARLLARPDSRTLAVLGTGAQSEFLVLALLEQLPLREVRYFDPDLHAMMKFARNIEDAVCCLEPCGNVAETLQRADVVVAATSAPQKLRLLEGGLVPAGAHVHALADGELAQAGLDPALLARSRLAVDARRSGDAAEAGLQQLLRGDVSLREAPDDLTLLVSTGVGLQDFSALRTVHALADSLGIGDALGLLAQPEDPKDLYRMLTRESPRGTVSALRQADG
ncbi:MAG: hypothetical protein RLZ44_1852 [Pseudomonadota bacterium]